MFKKIINKIINKKKHTDHHVPAIHKFLKEINQQTDLIEKNTVILVFYLNQGQAKNECIFDLYECFDYSDDHDNWLNTDSLIEGTNISGYSPNKTHWFKILKNFANNIIDFLNKNESKQGLFSKVDYIGIYFSDSDLFMIKHKGKIQNKLTDYDVKIYSK